MNINELIEVSFNPANTVLSILLVLSVLYWILTMITGVGDFDIDFDTDGDFDTPDGMVEVPSDPSSFIQFLKFLNLDIIPITFLLTLVLLFTWLININISYYIPLPFWMYFITIFPAIFIGVFVTKYICLPLKPFFKEINHKGEIPYDYLGRIGILKSTIEKDKLGMLEIIINKDPIKLMVKSNDGSSLKEGEKACIVNESSDKKFYLVEKSYEI